MRLLELSIPICDLRLQKGKKSFSVVMSKENHDENVNQGNLKKRKKDSSDEIEDKRKKMNTSKDSEYKLSSAEEDDDSDSFTIYKVNSRKNRKEQERRKKNTNKSKKKEKHQQMSFQESPKKLSSYEQMIAKNCAEKMAFLQSLKIDEIKFDINASVKAVKATKRKPQRVKKVYNQVKEPSSPPVLRKSRRLAKLDIDLSEEAIYRKFMTEAEDSLAVKQERDNQRFERFGKKYSHIEKGAENSRHWIKLKHISTLPEMTFKHALQFDDLYDSFVKDVNISAAENKESKFCPYESLCNIFRRFTEYFPNPWKHSNAYLLHHSRPLSKYNTYSKSDIKNLTLDENNIAKVTADRISAMAWYPSAEQLIVAAGSKYGNLGIWNVKSDSNPFVFKVHTDTISCMKFNPYNQSQMFTTSYDGVLRCGDFSKQTFEQVYESTQSTCTYFDFLSENTFLVAQRNGEVAIVDNRIRGKSCGKTHSCHDYSIKTVDVHPVNKNVFVSAEVKGRIRLWDLRKLQTNPVAENSHHQRSVNSAYFSPVTGNSILTTSLDDTICLFDSTGLTQNIELKQLMKHNNFTGRWLSIFRATWLPNSEEAFVVGSMLYPRRIEVYDRNMDVYHIVMHDNLTTITSVNAFHPYIPALAAANSSGKVVVFT